jgi:hypothetical protein
MFMLHFPPLHPVLIYPPFTTFYCVQMMMEPNYLNLNVESASWDLGQVTWLSFLICKIDTMTIHHILVRIERADVCEVCSRCSVNVCHHYFLLFPPLDQLCGDSDWMNLDFSLA